MSGNTIPTGLGIGLLAAACYGANVPYAKLAALAGADGPTLVFYRAFLMVALLGTLGLLRGGTLHVPRDARPAVLGLALATSVVGICYLSSVAFIPVGVATIVYYAYPLLILAVSPFIDGQRLTSGRLAIFLLAFAGLFIVIGPTFAALDWRGLLLAGAGAAGAAAQFFCAARAMRAIGPAVAGFWTQLILIPIAFLSCLLAGGPASPAVLFGAAWPVAMHIGLFLAAFGLQLVSARMAPPAALGMVFCAEPIASIVIASQVLGEGLSITQIVGGALVLAAVVASVTVEVRRKPLLAT